MDMKTSILAIIFLLITATVAYSYNFKILKVIDGDTLIIEAPYLPKELGNTVGIRILGVDTPEKAPRAKCEAEAEKGAAATEFTKRLVANARTKTIILKSWDKYGGRVLGDVLLDGKPLSKSLIDAKLAVAYYGGTKINWCEFLKNH